MKRRIAHTLLLLGFTSLMIAGVLVPVAVADEPPSSDSGTPPPFEDTNIVHNNSVALPATQTASDNTDPEDDIEFAGSSLSIAVVPNSDKAEPANEVPVAPPVTEAPATEAKVVQQSSGSSGGRESPSGGDSGSSSSTEQSPSSGDSGSSSGTKQAPSGGDKPPSDDPSSIDTQRVGLPLVLGGLPVLAIIGLGWVLVRRFLV